MLFVLPRCFKLRTFIQSLTCIFLMKQDSSLAVDPATPMPSLLLPNCRQGNDDFYKSLMDKLPTGVYTCNKEGNFTFYNETAAQLWGCRPQLNDSAYRFCAWYKVLTPEGAVIPRDQTPIATVLETGQSFHNLEAVVERENGQQFYISVNIDPLLDEQNNIIGAINIFQDFTSLKKTEMALLESEARYRHLAESLEKKIEEKTLDLIRKTEELKKSEERYHKMVEEVEDYAIILLDKEGIIRNWNKGAEKIKGYKEEEIVGKSFSNFYLPDDRSKGLHTSLLELARRSGKAIHEGWRMRKDGTAFWGSIVLTALHNNEGEVIGFSKVTRDLTERKLAEDTLREYTTQLEFQNKELEEFSYAASHDMKEPLRKIIFYNNHLWENAADKLSEREKDYLGRSINAAKRMKSLIDDLLEYSKATMVQQGLEPVDLNALVEEIIHSYKDVIEQHDVSVSSAKLPTVSGVSFQLRQLFDNLISNSLKYHHPDRKLVIRIDVEKTMGGTIKGLRKQTAYYKIIFSDNGTGFDPDYAEKIFELFQRLDPARCSGTGVGLSLCKKIVQNHHGTIVAQSKMNEGASFEIYLPC